VTISSWLNFGRPAPQGRGSAAEQKNLALPYYSQRALFHFVSLSAVVQSQTLSLFPTSCIVCCISVISSSFWLGTHNMKLLLVLAFVQAGYFSKDYSWLGGDSLSHCHFHINGHFPGKPRLASTRMSSFWMMQIFYSPDALPVTQPTMSKHLSNIDSMKQAYKILCCSSQMFYYTDHMGSGLSGGDHGNFARNRNWNEQLADKYVMQ